MDMAGFSNNEVSIFRIFPLNKCCLPAKFDLSGGKETHSRRQYEVQVHSGLFCLTVDTLEIPNISTS